MEKLVKTVEALFNMPYIEILEGQAEPMQFSSYGFCSYLYKSTHAGVYVEIIGQGTLEKTIGYSLILDDSNDLRIIMSSKAPLEILISKEDFTYYLLTHREIKTPEEFAEWMEGELRDANSILIEDFISFMCKRPDCMAGRT